MSHAKRALEEQMAEIDPDEADEKLRDDALWVDPETAARWNQDRLARQAELRRIVEEWMEENRRR